MKEWLFAFDLDDTLYPEREYVLSGFKAVSDYLQRWHNLKGFFEKAKARFEKGERGKIFDSVLTELGQSEVQRLVFILVFIYRHHQPEIHFYPGAVNLLSKLSALSHLAIISDGPVESQTNKADALGLPQWFKLIIFTEAFGKEYAKPNPLLFQFVQQKFRVPPQKCFYIADNPEKDFVAGNQLGWQTVQIIHPDQVRPFKEFPGSFQAKMLVNGFSELDQILKRIGALPLKQK